MLSGLHPGRLLNDRRDQRLLSGASGVAPGASGDSSWHPASSRCRCTGACFHIDVRGFYSHRRPALLLLLVAVFLTTLRSTVDFSCPARASSKAPFDVPSSTQSPVEPCAGCAALDPRMLERSASEMRCVSLFPHPPVFFGCTYVALIVLISFHSLSL